MKKLAENAKIPCAVCRDLMPLVQDGIASPESEQLVRAHIAVCPACQALWQRTELLFTLGLAVLDAIIKQMALLESFAPGNFLANLVSGCILYVGLGGVGWLIGWLLHYAKESTHENKS